MTGRIFGQREHKTLGLSQGVNLMEPRDDRKHSKAIPLFPAVSWEVVIVEKNVQAAFHSGRQISDAFQNMSPAVPSGHLNGVNATSSLTTSFQLPLPVQTYITVLYSLEKWKDTYDEEKARGNESTNIAFPRVMQSVYNRILRVEIKR